MKNKKLLSFVVPVKDEEATVRELYTRIAENVQALGHEFELIYIDDGSTDGSWEEIQKVSTGDSRVSGIRFRRNIGKANALTAGFGAASGEIVFTMDADLQDDPQEIGRFLEKLDEGFDVVSGWKKTRHDPWHKVLPSRVFNKMISNLVGVHLHDHNCGFKCYRAKVVKDVSLYGEMHRMIPSLASLRGYKSSEIPVQHHRRMHGQSKYGVKRFLRGFMDLLTVYFLKHYKERPLHLMGGSAIVVFLSGVLIMSLTAAGALPLASNVFSAALMVGALPLAALGFMSELLISRRTSRDRDLPICETAGGMSKVTAQISEMPRVVVEKGARVLVVDDQVAVQAAYSIILSHEGYLVEEALTVAEALEKISRETAVVLLDLGLPDGNGIEVLRDIRRRFVGIKVVVVSAAHEADIAVTAMKLGAFDYLTKPISKEKLLDVVASAIEIRSISERHALSA